MLRARRGVLDVNRSGVCDRQSRSVNGDTEPPAVAPSGNGTAVTATGAAALALRCFLLSDIFEPLPVLPAPSPTPGAAHGAPEL